MKKYYLIRLFCLCFLSPLVSCTDDEEESNCLEQLGQFETNINNQTLFQAQWTVFEFFENDALSVTAIVVDQDCLLRAIMGFTSEPNLDRQNFTDTVDFREPTNISISQINQDAVLGSWRILEGEPNWVQFEEITETSVTGMLQATLVIRENGNNFQTLPDTLRFDNVRFEAVPDDLLNGSN